MSKKNTPITIGRVFATEKAQSSIDEFYFWTKQDLILNPFDVVAVSHYNNSTTYASIEEIYHITDSASFLSEFISNDFGDVDAARGTLRVGMNYVKAKVLGNDQDIFIPVANNSQVSLASKEEIEIALGLDEIKNPLVCGYLEMYNNVKKTVPNCEKVTIPVPIDSNFLLGPEGAHLNISGISGLAAKTSYAMFLLKSIQDKQDKEEVEDNTAFVLFNVKGKDLLAIDQPNDFEGDKKEEREVKELYSSFLHIDPKPFHDVTYFYPASDIGRSNTYAPSDLLNKQIKEDKTGWYYKFIYEHDKDLLDLFFAGVDDNNDTMESILNYIATNESFSKIKGWEDFIEAVRKKTESGSNSDSKELSVLSWRKFLRYIKKALKDDGLFGVKAEERDRETRLAEKIREIRARDIYVIDIAKLDTELQNFVFGSVIKQIMEVQLDEKEVIDGKQPPSKIVVFVDELNKFAGKDKSEKSPILRQILDIAERGRSLGVVLFGAEQFKSGVHKRVSGNCSTFAYGRTNSIELHEKDYGFISSVNKNIITRLKQGEYIIQNPRFKTAMRINFPKPLYKQFK